MEKSSKEADVAENETEKEAVKPVESYTNGGAIQNMDVVGPNNEVFVINDVRGKEPLEVTDGNRNELPVENVTIVEMRL